MPLRPLVLAVLGSLVAGSLGTLGTAAPAQARGSLQCFAQVQGVTPRGVPATFTYEKARATSEVRGPDDLGYQPRDLALPHATEGGKSLLAPRAGTTTSHWFTLSGDQLREVTEVDRRDGRGRLVSASYRTRVVRKHWSGVRQISIGRDRDHLYALTNDDELLRYRLSGKDGNTTVKLDATVGTGFGTVGTFEYARTEDGADVFLATDADTGALLEYAVPVDDPTAYTSMVLQPEGWFSMQSVGRTASCLNAESGRTYDGIVGVDLDGRVRLWTDRDSADGSGADIVRRGVLKGDWKPLAYSD